MRKNEDNKAYDYIVTWVVNLICVTKGPEKYMGLIEQQFNMRNVKHNSAQYLGSDLNILLDSWTQVACEIYINKTVHKYEKNLVPFIIVTLP